MKKSAFLLLLFTVQLVYGQSPTLIQDYIPGPQGSIDNRIYNFNNKLVYEGTNLFGEKSILQYDKLTDEITVLATNEDFEGNILSISSNMEELVVFTGDGNSFQHFYRSFENDLSDLQKIYSSGEAAIRRIRFYQGNTLIMEEKFDGIDYTTTIKVIDASNEVLELYTNLPGRPFDYDYTSMQDHFVISPALDLIDGKTIIAFSLQEQSIVDITELIPDFIDCGMLNRIASAQESVFFYDCDQVSYAYDLGTGEYINYNDPIFFVVHYELDYIYITAGDSFYRIDKFTGQEELIVDQIITSRATNTDFIVLHENDGAVDISYFDFDDRTEFTYPTTLSLESNYRLAGFASVPSGVHFTAYELGADDGFIARVNSESFTFIDTLYNVSFGNRPVAYDEDIYFTHEAPEVGNELFVIDYEVSSTNETKVAQSFKISPNPAQDIIRLHIPEGFEPEKASIFDLNGQLIRQSKFQSTLTIDELASGLYVLSISDAQGDKMVERFVVR